MKDVNDECERKVLAFMESYSHSVENSIMSEATLICPIENPDSLGLASILNRIDFKKDFDVLMKSFMDSHEKSMKKSKSETSFSTLLGV